MRKASPQKAEACNKSQRSPIRSVTCKGAIHTKCANASPWRTKSQRKLVTFYPPPQKTNKQTSTEERNRAPWAYTTKHFMVLGTLKSRYSLLGADSNILKHSTQRLGFPRSKFQVAAFLSVFFSVELTLDILSIMSRIYFKYLYLAEARAMV